MAAAGRRRRRAGAPIAAASRRSPRSSAASAATTRRRRCPLSASPSPRSAATSAELDEQLAPLERAPASPGSRSSCSPSVALVVVALPRVGADARRRRRDAAAPDRPERRQHQLLGAGADAALLHRAQLPARGAAADDELHAHRHRAEPAAPGARHAGGAAEPGGDRPQPLPHLLRDGPDDRQGLRRRLPAVRRQQDRLRRGAQARREPGARLHDEADAPGRRDAVRQARRASTRR